MHMCGGNSKSCIRGWRAIRAGNEANVARTLTLPSPGVPGEGKMVGQAPPYDCAKSELRRDHFVRIDDEFLGRAFVEILVALGSIIQRNHRRVYRLGDLDLVVEDGHHQIAVVALDGALASDKGVALGPAQADADAEVADFGVGVDAAGMAGNIEAGDAQSAAGAGDF